ncbi:MAG TPA: hypothetical protein VGI81_17050 [Tepidisphaeraceae bacterium]|jgi:hypothetical protein
MRVAAVRQWQWILISLALGAAIGSVRNWMAADLEGRFCEPINGQARFEEALTRIVAGRPCFDHVCVYAASVPDRHGATKHAYVVTGDYFNGQFESSAGKLTAEWRPAFFVADVPYQPKTSLEALGRPDVAARFRAIDQPTIIDFLDVVSRAKGTSYTRARWMELGILGWMACSFVMIGLVWPAAINLLVYGSLRRPPEEKGIDLSKVKPIATPSPAQDPTEDDLARLGELEAALESNVSDAASAPPPTTAATAPVKPLGGADPEPVAAPATREAAEFAAAKEDYYPTAKGRSGQRE